MVQSPLFTDSLLFIGIRFIIRIRTKRDDSRNSQTEDNSLNGAPVLESRFHSRNFPFNIFTKSYILKRAKSHGRGHTHSAKLSLKLRRSKKLAATKDQCNTECNVFKCLALCARGWAAGKRGGGGAFWIFFTFSVVRFNYFSIRLLAAAAPLANKARYVHFCWSWFQIKYIVKSFWSSYFYNIFIYHIQRLFFLAYQWHKRHCCGPEVDPLTAFTLAAIKSAHCRCRGSQGMTFCIETIV